MEIESFYYSMGYEEDEDVYTIRTTKVKDDIYFCVKDLCDILGLDNAREAIRNLEHGEKIKVKLHTTRPDVSTNDVSQNRSLNFVSEVGFYELLFKSKKPEAKEFRKWVFNEVLPSIRKTGKYEPQNQVVVKKEEIHIETLQRLIESDKIKQNNLTIYHLAQDLLTQKLQQTTSTETIRIKDISQHMIDLGIDPTIITKFRCSVGKYVKQQYIEKYHDDPPMSDKNIKWNDKLVKVDDFHNGANRPVCWYPPTMYDEVKDWIKDFFRIKKPELQINPSPIIELKY